MDQILFDWFFEFISENPALAMLYITCTKVLIDFISPIKAISYGSSFCSTTFSNQSKYDASNDNCKKEKDLEKAVEAERERCNLIAKTLEVANERVPQVEEKITEIKNASQIESEKDLGDYQSFQIALNALHQAINFNKNFNHEVTSSVFFTVNLSNLSPKYYHKLMQEFTKSMLLDQQFSSKLRPSIPRFG